MTHSICGLHSDHQHVHAHLFSAVIHTCLSSNFCVAFVFPLYLRIYLQSTNASTLFCVAFERHTLVVNFFVYINHCCLSLSCMSGFPRKPLFVSEKTDGSNGVETFSGLKRDFNSLHEHGVFGSGCLRQRLPGLKGLKVSRPSIYRLSIQRMCMCVKCQPK